MSLGCGTAYCLGEVLIALGIHVLAFGLIVGAHWLADRLWWRR